MLRITRSIGAVILSLLLHFYFYSSEHIQKFDYDFYDLATKLSTKIEEPKSMFTVIVDIDEKSLQHFGQWPWPRVIDANLINMINEMQPSAIGLNILFPEMDRTSPLSIQKFYEKNYDFKIQLNEVPKQLKDNDKLLSQSIQNSAATLSTYFQNSSYTASHCQELSYKKNMFVNVESEFKGNSLLCNYSTIQDGVENFGFTNAWSDSDEIFRRIPLFMEYNKRIFPSFALATLLSFDKFMEIDTDESTILINFSKQNPKVFSASDILNGHVSSNEIQGKIVIIGSSIVGLNPSYPIASGKNISNSMINSFVIENLLNDSFLIQPEIFKQINILLSFLLSIFIILLLDKKQYIRITGLIAITAITSFLCLGYSYTNGVYISVGYLWTPFLYFFITILAYHAIILNEEKQEQAKLLIRQSKLASMGEMISLIAHQWRQPLLAIDGIVLKMDIGYKDKKHNKYLNEIKETTTYLSKTINNFTDFFSKSKNSETFYITDIVVQAAHLTPIARYKNIYIKYRKKEHIQVTGYKSELVQSLLIILNNALYACKKNLPSTGKGLIIIDTYTSKKHLFISIEDNGGGIEEKNFQKIFDPYFTTKKKAHGIGLGLYILKMIVEDSMNGKLSVENSEEGAIFTIKIPMNME